MTTKKQEQEEENIMFQFKKMISLLSLCLSWTIYSFSCATPVYALVLSTAVDCSGQYVSGDIVQAYLGDGLCDDGTWGVNLNCSTYNYDNGDCNSIGGGGSGYAYDCVGTLAPVATINSWIGDGYCDDGTYGLVLNCSAYNWDNGDCNWGGAGGGYTTDCVGNTIPVALAQEWLGDGYCDDGTYNGIVLYCAQYNWDYGDCGWGGGGGGGSQYVYDCDGRMVPANIVNSWYGDGYCDYGADGVNLNCSAYDYDGGDCILL